MNLDWTIIGVIVAIIIAIPSTVIGIKQLIRTPKSDNLSRFTSSKYKDLEKRLKDAKSAIEQEDLLLYIKWKYRGEPILERCGYIYPVAVYPAERSQREDFQSILKVPLNKEEEDISSLIIDNDEYLSLVNSLKPGKVLTLGKDVNTYTYALKSLSVNGKLQLECKLGRYFTTFRSCEILEWEIRSKVNKLKGRSEQHFQAFDRKLYLRKRLHQHISNPVLDGNGRSPAIGISVLIAYKDQGAMKLLTKRRSSKGVPLRAGLLHVVPGFMFQPTTQDVDYEFNITHNVYREYLEELFNLPENFHSNRHANHFGSDKRLVYLKNLIAEGNAKLYFTGITINLLNLRPEICMLLSITTPEWYEKCQNDPELRWDLNDEFFNIHRAEDEGIVKQTELVENPSFSTDDNQILRDAHIYPDRTVPAGAGAFWLGIDLLKELLPST